MFFSHNNEAYNFFLTCSQVVTQPPVKMKTMAVTYNDPQTKRARAPPQRLTVASQGRQTSRAELRQRTTHTTARAAAWRSMFCEEMSKNSRLVRRQNPNYNGLKITLTNLTLS